MCNCISALFYKGKHYALLLACTLLATFFAVSGAAAAEAKVRILATTYPRAAHGWRCTAGIKPRAGGVLYARGAATALRPTASRCSPGG